ncbi:hypothetical protein PQ469_02800 [Mucilaginibacter sp. KACC 22773]|uniref:XAC2610-related protein n=1 Tax=Mucilaginibacter sp. KACC 22773 TaxID=3025671 RepID=UPI002366916A|nr:hypothetical protein [Mucilaginibacter sp. KACC 22773]WDF78933.1 hypothetical protein PQ469_02800 [Mucilaginibacter sp. KACC 22773]
MLKRILLGLALIMALGCYANGQAHTYSKLSHKFVFKIQATWFKDTDDVARVSNVKLSILNKTTNDQQVISFLPGWFFEGVFKSDSASRSYVTGYNKSLEVIDYDFGDLVIADLNFDGKEDLAIKYDSGGNGGPIYNFYLQDNKGYFHKDNYLTDRVGSFPREIDIKHKTITTQVHANVRHEGRKTFKYYPKTKQWRLVKWIMV